MENTHVNESILSAEILEDQKKNRIDHMTYLPGMEDIGSEVLDQSSQRQWKPMIMTQYTEADVQQSTGTQ